MLNDLWILRSGRRTELQQKVHQRTHPSAIVFWILAWITYSRSTPTRRLLRSGRVRDSQLITQRARDELLERSGLRLPAEAAHTIAHVIHATTHLAGIGRRAGVDLSHDGLVRDCLNQTEAIERRRLTVSLHVC